MSNENIFDKIRKRVKEANKMAMNTAFRNALSKVMAKQVRIRTRIGKGVKETGGPSYNLHEVLRTSEYEEYRIDQKEIGELASSTVPSKHNLTLRGHLLDALYGKAVPNGFSINVRDARPDSRRNSKIIEGQRKLGRHFLNLSKTEMRQMRRAIRKKIVQQILNEFK